MFRVPKRFQVVNGTLVSLFRGLIWSPVSGALSCGVVKTRQGHSGAIRPCRWFWSLSLIPVSWEGPRALSTAVHLSHALPVTSWALWLRSLRSHKVSSSADGVTLDLGLLLLQGLHIASMGLTTALVGHGGHEPRRPVFGGNRILWLLFLSAWLGVPYSCGEGRGIKVCQTAREVQVSPWLECSPNLGGSSRQIERCLCIAAINYQVTDLINFVPGGFLGPPPFLKKSEKTKYFSN